ncbi:MAG: signal peptidase I [Solirubrobacteraceae bacterium]
MATPTRPRRGNGRLRGLVELVVTIAIAVAVAYGVQAFLVKPYRIPSGSMEPTLHVGQRILVFRLADHPSVGDVVVFHPPVGSQAPLGAECADAAQGPGHHQPCDVHTRGESGQTYVKRVVGLPGDRLSIRDGAVYRNGLRERVGDLEPCPEQARCTFSTAITVPRGEYYMMGDNRGDSDDSRYWGPVPQSWIVGTAFFTYWPPGRIGTL